MKRRTAPATSTCGRSGERGGHADRRRRGRGRWGRGPGRSRSRWVGLGLPGGVGDRRQRTGCPRPNDPDERHARHHTGALQPGRRSVRSVGGRRRARPWFAAWTDDDGDEDVAGTKVLPSGVPVTSGGAALAGGAGVPEDTVVTRGATNTAFLTWFTPGSGLSDIDFTRRLDADAVPFGPATRSTRAPIPRRALTWPPGTPTSWSPGRRPGGREHQCVRSALQPHRQPHGADHHPLVSGRGPALPAAAWNGSNWLVAWTDARFGTTDVFGRFVSGAGAVSPAAAFAISTAASNQQSPSGAWNGANFVVAWNDLRNGSQDIFASRVASDGTVLDAGGIAITTAAGIQRAPSASSAGGPTLIAWTGNTVQRRILRSNGRSSGASSPKARPSPARSPPSARWPRRTAWASCTKTTLPPTSSPPMSCSPPSTQPTAPNSTGSRSRTAGTNASSGPAATSPSTGRASRS